MFFRANHKSQESVQDFIQRLRSMAGEFTVQVQPAKGWNSQSRLQIYCVSREKFFESAGKKIHKVEKEDVLNIPQGLTIQELKAAFQDYARQTAEEYRKQEGYEDIQEEDVCRVHNIYCSVKGIQQFQVVLG